MLQFDNLWIIMPLIQSEHAISNCYLIIWTLQIINAFHCLNSSSFSLVVVVRQIQHASLITVLWSSSVWLVWFRSVWFQNLISLIVMQMFSNYDTRHVIFALVRKYTVAALDSLLFCWQWAYVVLSWSSTWQTNLVRLREEFLWKKHS